MSDYSARRLADVRAQRGQTSARTSIDDNDDNDAFYLSTKTRYKWRGVRYVRHFRRRRQRWRPQSTPVIADRNNNADRLQTRSAQNTVLHASDEQTLD